ncbi:MAG: TonB-dependent receptor, partial [Saprospiraceae bacterium]
MTSSFQVAKQYLQSSILISDSMYLFAKILFIFFILPSWGVSQVLLDSIQITESKPFSLSSITEDHRSSDTVDLDILDFIGKINTGQIQQTTPGGLATFIHRGMGNRHLPILWNGVNLQNIMNGSYDLHLIPFSLMNDVSFFTLGAPALTGNNGFAGALLLSRTTTKNSNHISASLSSLQNYGWAFSKQINRSQWSTYIGVEAKSDQNIYKVNTENENIQRPDTRFKKFDINAKTKYYINKKQALSAEIWWQTAKRMIPVSITSTPIPQTQADQNFRANVQYQHLLTDYHIRSSLTYMNEQLDFETPSILSLSNTSIWVSNTEIVESKSKTHYLAIQYRSESANPNFYSSTKKRNTFQLSGAKKIEWASGISSEISARQDLVDKRWMPTSLTISNQYKKWNLILSRNYNLPGFNDLYWPSGGNPTLKTEKSHQVELKWDAQISNWNVKIAGHTNHVKDWIQWIPQSNGIWSPT